MARGSADRYFQQEINDHLKLVPEGVEGRVPFKGPVSGVIHQLVGGSGPRWATPATPPSAISSRTMNLCASLTRAFPESHAHDVVITQEAPNYRRNS